MEQPNDRANTTALKDLVTRRELHHYPTRSELRAIEYRLEDLARKVSRLERERWLETLRGAQSSFDPLLLLIPGGMLYLIVIFALAKAAG